MSKPKATKQPPHQPEPWAAWDVERRSIDSLIPYARNARTHSDAQVAEIAASIREFGWTIPVLVSEDGTLIAGHGRIMAARLLGITEVPAMVARGWSETQRRAYCLLDNRVPMNAGWDMEMLAAEVRAIDADLDAGLADFDLSILGFTDTELTEFTDPMGGGSGDAGGGEAENETPAIQVLAIARPGEVWNLGAHRLVCGDCTDAATVAALLDGEKPTLMVTDPPYGVEYDPAWRNEADGGSRKRTGKVENDDDRADWRAAWALYPGTVAYVWHANRTTREAMDSLEATGFELRQQIIWAKSKMTLGMAAYHWKHEPCWYAVRKGSDANWKGGRKQTTLWTLGAKLSDADDVEQTEGLQADDAATVHGTQKPVELMRRPILNHTDAGGVVYDPFLGSGSTLIAAQTTGRVCLGCELDPVYVDLIIRRWQAFTGQAAKLAGDGRAFDVVAAERS